MADPLSISASILVLLDTTRGSLKVIDDLTEESLDAPADIASLASSLHSLMGILDSVVHDEIKALTDSGRKPSPSFQALDFIAA